MMLSERQSWFSTGLLVAIGCSMSSLVVGHRIRHPVTGTLEKLGDLAPRSTMDKLVPGALRLEPDPACKWTREPDPHFSAEDFAKGYCEAKVQAGADLYSLMDGTATPPIQPAVVSNRSVPHLMPNWTVEYDLFDGAGKPFHVKTEFDGKMWWWWPSGISKDASRDRVLFLHGCHSDCKVQPAYYSTLTSKLAHHMQMPVLGHNFAAEPEHPWPNNVKSIMLALEHITKYDPFGESSLRSLFIVGDSEGGLVTMHTMMALLDSSTSTMLGIPASLRPPSLPLAGVVVMSPTVNIQCTEESMLYNSWGDKAPGSGDISTYSNVSDPMSPPDRIDDCRWSYVNYFFGLPASGTIRSNADARRAYFSHPIDFWTSPQINPLFFDFSKPHTPPILITTGAADYFASSGMDLAEHICSCGARVEHFLAPGMWHDFEEYSEGCGNPAGVPLAAGIEAYKRIESFAKRHKFTKTEAESWNDMWNESWPEIDEDPTTVQKLKVD